MTEKSRKGIGGRPEIYTDELADKICHLVGGGYSLVRACKEVGISTFTVYKWIRENEKFSANYAQARGDQADYHFDLAWDIACEPCPEGMSASEWAANQRVRIDTIKWRAGKMKPKKYGEKLELEHSGKVEQVQIIDNIRGKSKA